MATIIIEGLTIFGVVEEVGEHAHTFPRIVIRTEDDERLTLVCNREDCIAIAPYIYQKVKISFDANFKVIDNEQKG